MTDAIERVVARLEVIRDGLCGSSHLALNDEIETLRNLIRASENKPAAVRVVRRPAMRTGAGR